MNAMRNPNRTGPRHRAQRLLQPSIGTLGVLTALFVVGLMLIPSAAAEGVGSAQGFTLSDLSNSLIKAGPSVLNLSYQAPVNLSPIFWGTTASVRASILPDQGELFNATSNQVILWPGATGGDVYEPVAPNSSTPNATYPGGVVWALGGGSYSKPSTNESQFVSWCESIHCKAIFQVPGEINEPSVAEDIVNYTVKTLHFYPIYWEIGNEPELWKHWGLPWKAWKSSDKRPAPLPEQYANEVVSYTRAMREVLSNISVIGIPAAARQGTNDPYTLGEWTYNVTSIAYATQILKASGNSVDAVSFHEYPGGGASKGITLKGFYQSLVSTSGLPWRMVETRTNVSAAIAASGCTSCTQIPVFVTELGSALSKKGFGQDFSPGFPGALATSVEIMQAMALNVTNVDLFAGVFNTTNSWLTLQGQPRPVYFLYSEILSHLGTEAFNVTFDNNGVNTSNVDNTVWGMGTLAPTQGDRADLLVTNVNLTDPTTFMPEFPDNSVYAGEPVEVWTWNGTPAVTDGVTTSVSTTTTPVGYYFPNGMPSSWTLPPQSLALFEAYPVHAEPVNIRVSGLSPGSMWFANVDGRTYDTNTTNMTLFLPPGNLSISSPFTYYETRTPREKVIFAKERLQPFVIAPASVGSAPVSASIQFVQQWKLNITSDPASQGTVSPAVTWANASEPLTLEAVPAPGDAFVRWTSDANDTRNGSYNGRNQTITIVPNGTIVEIAHFTQGFIVSFNETGLPLGTTWSVLIRGTNFTSASNGIITALEPNGSFGYHVNAISGYRTMPTNSSFNVTGRPVNVSITFIKRHLPPVPFPVVFNETGLPPGIPWSIIVRNVTFPTVDPVGTSFSFEEPNGTYGYHVNKVLGYRSMPTNSSFNVTGTTTFVNVTFILLHPPPPPFPVTFWEIGLPSGTEWSITVRNGKFSLSGSSISVQEINGTYGFNASVPAGYHANYTRSGFTVNGSALTILITYIPRQTSWAVHWVEQGLWSGQGWSVVVNGSTDPSTAAWITVTLANGSYPFWITGSSFIPHPAQGVVSVTGGNLTLIDELAPKGAPVTTVNITFTVPPIPSVWVLGLKAAGVGTAIGLASWGTVFLLQRRRRRSGPAALES